MSAAARAQARWQATRAARAAEAPTIQQLRTLLTAVETHQDPPALMGLDDLDPDVLAELLPARARLNGDNQ